MNEGLQPSRPSRIAAGEVLRKIYGDDFSGCVVTLDSIANIIDESAGSASEKDRTLIEVLTKVVEALQLLATPPAKDQVGDPEQLVRLLGERLDGIRDLALKTLETVKSVNSE
jgi:hypothetical protein